MEIQKLKIQDFRFHTCQIKAENPNRYRTLQTNT
jgi:hypothetical protein